MVKQNGFSLIELLIVVAIILVIAAIAIPSLLRSKIAANEASAVESLRAINTAEVTYAASYPELGFAVLASLGGSGGSSSAAGLVDTVLSNGAKAGYTFAVKDIVGTPGATYVATGIPTSVGQTGQRGFCSDNSSVIRYNADGSAIADQAACGALAPVQ